MAKLPFLLIKLLPVGLRGATLASKFILIVFMAKYLQLSDIGLYALIVAGISYITYFLGFDFYTYSSRELIGSDEMGKSTKLKNQFSLYFFLYSVVLLVSFVLYKNYPQYKVYVPVLTCILILEHLSQEVMRLLVVMGMPLIANIQFFIKGGAWVYVYIFVSYYVNDFNINNLWCVWLVADFISIFFIIFLSKHISIKYFFRAKIDLRWIFSGFKICIPLLIATLALRGIYTADRYLLSFFSGANQVGIYAYFSSFSSALMAFIDAAVVVVYYPKLLSLYKNGDLIAFRNEKKKFYKAVSIVGISVSLILAFLVPAISVILKKEQILSMMGVFYILLLSSFMYCYSLVPHFELYAKGRDSELIKCTVTAFLISLPLMLLGSYYFSAYGVALGQLVAISIMYYLKRKMTLQVLYENEN